MNNYKNDIISLSILLLVILLNTAPIKTQAQENNYRIKFISSFNSGEMFKSNNLIDEVFSFLVGQEYVKLNTPISLSAIDTSSIIVLDQGLQKLVLFDCNDREAKIIDSDYELPSLVSICRFTKNNYLFTDSRNGKVYKYDIASDEIESLNDTLELNRPTGIAFLHSKNEIWITETGEHRLTVIDNNGEIVKTIGRKGTGAKEFNYPTNICIDEQGFVYVVDALNFRIHRYNSDGTYLSMFGEQGDATGYFARPKGIATDSYGNIYIVDALFHTVQIFNSQGKYLSNIGSQGREKGNLWLPNGIFIDKNDRIYIADSYNSRIQIFQISKNSYE